MDDDQKFCNTKRNIPLSEPLKIDQNFSLGLLVYEETKMMIDKL
jgi:hypothetical protein